MTVTQPARSPRLAIARAARPIEESRRFGREARANLGAVAPIAERQGSTLCDVPASQLITAPLAPTCPVHGHRAETTGEADLVVRESRRAPGATDTEKRRTR